MPDGQDGSGNLRGVRLFKGLADRELRKLAPLLEARQYRPGQFIFQVGEKADCLYFLDRGIVKISLTSPEGEESLLDVLKAGDTFGELFFDKSRHRVVTAQAVTDVAVRLIMEEVFRGLMRTWPALCLSFIRHLVDQQRRTFTRLTALLHAASGPRLLAMLLDLGERCAPLVGDRYTLPGELTQENLAKMAGLNRSTASRIINDYRRRKILGGQRGMLVIYRSRTRTALKKAGLTVG
jgi:CRP/FNR family transcriptional regulator, cyclic AMP receptor protein